MSGEDQVKLIYKNQEYELPLLSGTEEDQAIDIRKLRSQTGWVTLDPGFGNTASCESQITYLDGEKGVLRYRGHSVDDLADHYSFLAVAYLLIEGTLPNEKSYEEFLEKVSFYVQSFPEDMYAYIDSFPVEAHPMLVLSSAITMLSHYEESSSFISDSCQIDSVVVRLMVQSTILISYFYRRCRDQKFVFSQFKKSYAQFFLSLVFPEKQFDEHVINSLESLFILHADHEQNCSTSAVRLVGSSKVSPYVAISSGVHALWGPLHGGANQKVVEMLEAIYQDGGDCEKYIRKAKDKEDSFLLMGFGHRVYKNFDPRERHIKKKCSLFLEKLGVSDPLLSIANRLEKVAREDQYFIDRNLYPNVDFYSGIMYRAMGFSTKMFPVLFALGRMPGWGAHYKEMVLSGGRISRPRQLYLGKGLIK